MKVVPLAVALVAVSALAAEKEKIAVVDLDAPPGMLGLSTQVLKSVMTEAQRQKRAIITPEELREKLGNKTLNELVKCADSPACAADKLTVLGATHAVLGKLNRDDKNYILQLWLIDLGGLRVVTDVDRSVLIASRRFQKDVDAAVPGFLRGEREAKGTLVINATTANAQVTLNGEFMGVTPLTTTLKPGKYEVKVEKPKFLPVKRLVNVEPNQKTVEDFRLLLQPGESEDELAPLKGPVAGADEKQGGGPSVSAGTIIVGVASLAALGTGIAFGVMSQNLARELERGYDMVSGTYAGTRAQALTARTNALIANICYGVAGVAAIVTVVLAVLDARAPAAEAAVEVAPAVTPGGGAGLFIGGHF